MNSRITMVNGSVLSNLIWVLDYHGFGKPLGQQMNMWMSLSVKTELHAALNALLGVLYFSPTESFTNLGLCYMKFT